MTLSAYTILCLDQGYVNQFLEKGNISSTARNGLSTDPEQMLLIATPKLAAYTRGGGRYGIQGRGRGRGGRGAPVAGSGEPAGDGPAGKGAEAGKGEPAGKGGTAGKGGPAGKEEWSCGLCTFLNPCGATQCQVCDTPRAAPTVAPATGTTADTGAPATGTPADTGAPATGTFADNGHHTSGVPWACPDCTLQNPTDAARCSACGFPQPAPFAPLPNHGTVPAAGARRTHAQRFEDECAASDATNVPPGPQLPAGPPPLPSFIEARFVDPDWLHDP